jgi:phosphate transport system protein
LAYAIILEDNCINRGFEEINQLCHGFVARHLPSAGHLRMVSSILRMNIELERIGDYAVTICREAVQFSNPYNKTMLRNIEQMANESLHILNLALKAFNENNAELAESTMGLSDRANITFINAYHDLTRTKKLTKWSLRELLGLFVVYYEFERISDQAKNICEATLFTVKGEPKKQKIFHILFLDQENNCQSQMAEFFAKKAFPKSGRYFSAGLTPAEKLDPKFVSFMDSCGFDLTGMKPKSMDKIPKLDNFHVVVSLQGPIKSYISTVPFHTSVLEWDVAPPLSEIADDQIEEHLNNIYKTILVNIRILMETLCVEEESEYGK